MLICDSSILKCNWTKEESWSVLLENFAVLCYLSIAIYHCIMIFWGQCIDTCKFCIIPSLLKGQIPKMDFIQIFLITKKND